MLTVTKKFEFSYSHNLPDYDGDCKNLHGHNSNVEVTFSSHGKIPVSYGGMVIDFKDISKQVKPIIMQLDHKHLNDIPGLEIPTAENITLWLVMKIQSETSLGPGLVKVRVSETNNSFAEWIRGN